MADTPIVRIESDAKQAIAEAAKLQAAFLSEAQAVLTLTKVYTDYNTTGEAFQTVVKGIVNGTKEVIITIDKATGAYKINQNNLLALAKEAQNLAVKQSETAKTIVAGRPEIGIPQDVAAKLTDKQKESFQPQLDELANNLTNALSRAIKSGVRDKDTLSGFLDKGTTSSKKFSEVLQTEVLTALNALKAKQAEIAQFAEVNAQKQIATQQKLAEAEQRRILGVARDEITRQRRLQQQEENERNLVQSKGLLGFDKVNLKGTESAKELDNLAKAQERLNKLVLDGKATYEDLRKAVIAAHGRAPLSDFTTAQTQALSAVVAFLNARKNLGQEQAKVDEAQRKAAIAAEEAAKKQTDEINKTNAALRTQEELEKNRAARLETLKGAPRQALATFGGVPNLPSPGQVTAIAAAMQAVQKAIFSTDITLEEFKQTLQNVLSGSVDPAPQKLASLAAGFRQMKNAVEDVSSRGGLGGGRLIIGLDGIFRLVEVFLIRRSLIFLGGQLRDAASAAAELQVKAALLQNAFTPFSSSIDGTINKIRTLASEFGRSSVDVAEGAKRIANSHVGGDLVEALKLARVQEISVVDSTNLMTTALEAFNLKGTNSVEVVGLLDHAMQQGRGSASEFASGLATVGPLANRAGISLNTLLAAVNTLTAKGNTLSQSFSAIESVLRKVGSGGADIEKIFREVGVSTDKQFFSVLGLEKGYNLLVKKTEDLQVGLRGLRTGIHETEDALKGLSTEEQAQIGSSEKIEKKFKDIGEVLGEKFKENIENAKTLLQKDFGDTIVYTIDKLGGLVTGVKILEGTVGIALTGIIAYKSGLATFTAATLAADIAQVKLATTLGFTTLNAEGATVATEQFTLALSKLSAIAIGASFVGGYIIGAELFKDQARAFEENVKKTIALNKVQNDTILRQNIIATNQEVTEIKNKYDAQYQIILNWTAAVRQQINQQAELAKERSVETSAAFKDSTQGFLSGLRESIHASERAIEDSVKHVERIQNDFEKRKFQRRLDQAGTDPGGRQALIPIGNGIQQLQQLPAQATRLSVIVDEIARVNKRAEDLFNRAAKGDQSLAGEARRDLEEVGGLLRGIESSTKRIDNLQKSNVLKNYGDQITAIKDVASADIQATKLIQANAQHNAQLALKPGPVSDAARAQGAQTLALGLARIEISRVAAIARQNLAFEKQQQLLQKEVAFGVSRQLIAAIDLAQKDKLIALEQRYQAELAKRAEEEKALLQNTLGLVKQLEAISLFDKKNQFDPSQLEKYQRLLGQVLDQFDKVATADPKQIGNRLLFGQQALNQLRQLEAQKETETLNQEANTNQNRLIKNKETHDELLKQTQERLVKIENAEKASNERIQAIRQNIDRDVRPGPGRGQGAEGRNLLEALRQFDIQKTTENLATVNKRFDELFERLSKGFQTSFITNLVQQLKELQSLTSLSKGTGDSLIDLRRKLNDLESGNLISADDARRLNAISAALGGTRASLEPVQQSFESLRLETRLTIEEVEALSEAIKRIPTIPSVIPQPFVGPPNIPKSDDGGLVNWGPSGRDATLGRLTRGEFVVNADATKQFYSQLVSMNSMRGYAQGGLVGGDTVTVGDININMSGGRTEEQSVRRIGNAIQREIRRGTIRLN